MEKFINNLAQDYFYNEFVKNNLNLTFVCFQLEEGEKNIHGIHSQGVTGHISFKEDNEIRQSDRVFVKYLCTNVKFSQSNEFSSFSVEIYFYSKILPFFNQLRSMRYLVPEFYAGQQLSTCNLDKAAILLKHLQAEGYRNCNVGFLDYEHLSLMMRKIGEFHSYTFAARSKNSTELDQFSDLLSNVSAANSLNFAPAFVPTLLKNLQPLLTDPKYSQGAVRLEEIIRKLNLYSRKIRIRNYQDSCSILCHRSYIQQNVLFKYEKERPVDLKIMDWQTVGFGSLAMDLVTVLFVEANKKMRDTYWDQLLDDYYCALIGTFSHSDVPKKEHIFNELKIGLPFALCSLAYRVGKRHIHANNKIFEEAWSIWDDNFITEVCKDAIRRGLV